MTLVEGAMPYLYKVFAGKTTLARHRMGKNTIFYIVVLCQVMLVMTSERIVEGADCTTTRIFAGILLLISNSFFLPQNNISCVHLQKSMTPKQFEAQKGA